ncbi:MAG: hypothetical protein JOZ43_05540 [Acidobacteriales bacterium]|nr:hypothetical protein [Terriglobales bacterium]
MPGWTEALSVIVRYAPELRHLVPLLERATSPEARKRVQQAAEAAQRSVENTESTKQAIIEMARRSAAQNSEIMARLDSSDERAKLMHAELQALSQQYAPMAKTMRTAVLWLRVLTVLVVALIVLAGYSLKHH